MASRAEWAERVAEWRRSGLTAAEFCAGRDFAASTLRWYSSQVGPGKQATPTPRFAMVQVARERPDATSGGQHLVIETRGARVYVPVGVDEPTLAAVLRALGVEVSP